MMEVSWIFFIQSQENILIISDNPEEAIREFLDFIRDKILE